MAFEALPALFHERPDPLADIALFDVIFPGCVRNRLMPFDAIHITSSTFLVGVALSMPKGLFSAYDKMAHQEVTICALSRQAGSMGVGPRCQDHFW